ncbi:cytochrome c oxidase subunit 3 [Methylocapsa aurea]|uniref:cytochrome c oxidase subunit 3 n=1 Tax=Methylocapsa aurea TaxID=663610 RepID=UPI00068A49FE|nr:cytochrome c oxidase subunit 3 [Methylocapsa aurea]
MSIMFVFLGVIGTIAAWWLSRQRLASKPWLEVGAIDDAGASSLPAAKIGLGVFLAVVGALFALFFSAYVMRMHMVETNLADWKAPPLPGLLWLNTGVLILSSGALQWARGAARHREMEALKAGLIAGGVLSLAFLAGQLLAWRNLVDAGYFLASNPANAFFYLITGVHGLHVLGGLAALGATLAKAWDGVAFDQMRLSVELCAIYWHFLLLVWLVFFGLLLLTDPIRSESGLIAAICRVF